MKNKNNSIGKGMPNRWLQYKPMSDRIPGTNFIAFKVPLSEEFCNGLPIGKKFTPTILLQQVPDLCAVIDLTYTTRYYDSREAFVEKGIRYEKIYCPGQVIPPENLYNQFRDFVDDISRTAKTNQVIGVHCTHGLNRTGYFICRYMIERLKYNPDEAIKVFEMARGHTMERFHYLEAIRGFAAKSVQANPIENWRNYCQNVNRSVVGECSQNTVSSSLLSPGGNPGISRQTQRNEEESTSRLGFGMPERAKVGDLVQKWGWLPVRPAEDDRNRGLPPVRNVNEHERNRDWHPNDPGRGPDLPPMRNTYEHDRNPGRPPMRNSDERDRSRGWRNESDRNRERRISDNDDDRSRRSGTRYDGSRGCPTTRREDNRSRGQSWRYYENDGRQSWRNRNENIQNSSLGGLSLPQPPSLLDMKINPPSYSNQSRWSSNNSNRRAETYTRSGSRRSTSTSDDYNSGERRRDSRERLNEGDSISNPRMVERLEPENKNRDGSVSPDVIVETTPESPDCAPRIRYFAADEKVVESINFFEEDLAAKKIAQTVPDKISTVSLRPETNFGPRYERLIPPQAPLSPRHIETENWFVERTKNVENVTIE